MSRPLNITQIKLAADEALTWHIQDVEQPLQRLQPPLPFITALAISNSTISSAHYADKGAGCVTITTFYTVGCKMRGLHTCLYRHNAYNQCAGKVTLSIATSEMYLSSLLQYV